MGNEEYYEQSIALKEDRTTKDRIGVVTALEGMPLTGSDIAGRIGGFEDIAALEKSGASGAELVALILGTKNELHNNYQDGQAFLDNGGRMGMQHDPVLAGAFLINPAMFQVKTYPMLVIEQGEVAVIKAYVGLEESDTSGDEFKFGSLVGPGHKGVWNEVLRTGKYAINPSCYTAVIVPTSIITLNWAQATSAAHGLDERLEPIAAKSKEGFEVSIDLQVQIHIPDKKAPEVILSVGTVENLVNEVLQAAVGNHFRNKLQSMSAVDFIKKRQEIQEEAFKHIRDALSAYKIETIGVYIQDVIYPENLIAVLTEREIATQQIETFKAEEASQNQRIEMEKSKGTADMQAALSKSQVDITIKTNEADARKMEAEGESTYITKTGGARASAVEAMQLAEATGYVEKVKAIGREATALTTIMQALADSQVGIKILPDILIAGGGSALDGLAATLMKKLSAEGKDIPPVLEELLDKKSEEDALAEIEEVTEETEVAEAEEIPGIIESLKELFESGLSILSDCVSNEDLLKSQFGNEVLRLSVLDPEEITERDIGDLFSMAIDTLPGYATKAADKIRELESQAQKLLQKED